MTTNATPAELRKLARAYRTARAAAGNPCLQEGWIIVHLGLALMWSSRADATAWEPGVWAVPGFGNVQQVVRDPRGALVWNVVL